MIMHKTLNNRLWFIQKDVLLYEWYGVTDDVSIWLENQDLELTWLESVNCNHSPFNC